MAEPILTSLYSSITSYFTPTYLFCFLNLMIGTIFIASNFKSHKEEEEEDHHHNENQQKQLARVPSLLERVKSIDFSLYGSQQPDPTQLEPGPSLLQRVKSFSLYKEQRPDLHSDHTHYHPDPVYTQQVQVVQEQGSVSAIDTQYQAPSLLERVKSFSLYNSDQPDPDPDTQNSDQTRLVRYPTLLQRVKSIKLSLYPSDRPEPDSENDPFSDPDHHVTRSKSDKAPERVPVKMRKSASEKNVGPTEEGDDNVDRRRPESARERKRSETTSFGGEDEGVDAKADDFINKFKQQLKLQRLDSLIRYKEMLNRK